MTVDALQCAPDKTNALAEVARILRPTGRFAFVAFELDAERKSLTRDVGGSCGTTQFADAVLAAMETL